jgi:hypothetical protein
MTARDMDTIDDAKALWPEIFGPEVEVLGFGGVREAPIRPGDVEHLTVQAEDRDGGVLDMVAAAHLPARGRWGVLHWQRQPTKDGKHLPVVGVWLTGVHLDVAVARMHNPTHRQRLLGGDL